MPYTVIKIIQDANRINNKKVLSKDKPWTINILTKVAQVHRINIIFKKATQIVVLAQ